MRIKCETIADFITNLQSSESVYRSMVYFNRSRRQLDTGHDPTAHEIYYQVSAVLEFGDQEDALLEAGELCGVDRCSADGGIEGTDQQEALHRVVTAHCEANGLTLLPGILDL